jgi:hypothetical protein
VEAIDSGSDHVGDTVKAVSELVGQCRLARGVGSVDGDPQDTTGPPGTDEFRQPANQRRAHRLTVHRHALLAWPVRGIRLIPVTPRS